MHFPRATSKPELSTLLGSGTFYFALTLGGDDKITSSQPSHAAQPYVSGEVPKYWKANHY
jgi:hypothetical protein